MFLKRAWYVAGLASELGRAGAVHRQLVGEDVALFRDEHGVARAIHALCPHRGHNLALGQVVGGTLRCPWHAWTFNGEGRCLAIPSRPAARKIPAVARVARYPVTERHGLLWIWMDSEHDPTSCMEAIPALDAPGSRREYEVPALARGGWMNHIENTLNGAHLAFVHTGSMGPKLPPLVGDETVSFNEDMSGFEAAQSERAKATGVVSELNIINGGALRWLRSLVGIAPVRARVHFFRLPGVTLVHQEFENGHTEAFLGAVTPANAELTWFFLGSVRTRGLNSLGDFLQRRFMRKLLQEDVGICETPLANGPFGHPRPLSVGSDVKMLAFRALYARALQAEGQPVPWRC